MESDQDPELVPEMEVLAADVAVLAADVEAVRGRLHSGNRSQFQHISIHNDDHPAK